MCTRCRRRRRRRPCRHPRRRPHPHFRPRCRFSHPSLLHDACNPVARHAALVIKFDVVSPFLFLSLSFSLTFFSISLSLFLILRETRSVQPPPPPPSSPNLVGGCHGVRTCVCDLVASPARLSLALFLSLCNHRSPPPLSPSSTDRRTGRPHREPHQSPAEHRGTSARLCELR